MEPTAPTEPPSPLDPPQDPTATTVPNNITIILHVARILLDYGRHLIDTIHHRATAPKFNAIAACFGTANIATIRAHLTRGLLRAAALARVLLARAAAGQDIELPDRRPRTPDPQPAPAPTATEPEQSASVPPPARKRAPRPSLPDGWDDPELFMPSLQDLERQVRRRPIGRTMLDICSDLGVVPGFCTAPFWNVVHEIMHHLGGSVATLMRQKTQRREAFAKQQDHNPNANWDWLDLTRDATRQSTRSTPPPRSPPARPDPSVPLCWRQRIGKLVLAVNREMEPQITPNTQMDTDGNGANPLSRRIIGCALTVLHTLGTGFLEKVYENALLHELRKTGLAVSQQHPTLVQYDGSVVGQYTIDLLVEHTVLVEPKVARRSMRFIARSA
jgi:GxxExxY protein